VDNSRNGNSVRGIPAIHRYPHSPQPFRNLESNTCSTHYLSLVGIPVCRNLLAGGRFAALHMMVSGLFEMRDGFAALRTISLSGC
jgi:hypothetical protein